MAQCIVADPAASGALYVTAAEPCVSLVALTPAEYAQLAASPFNLTAEDSGLLSVAILGVWAVAWSFRALVQALNVDGEVIE